MPKVATMFLMCAVFMAAACSPSTPEVPVEETPVQMDTIFAEPAFEAAV